MFPATHNPAPDCPHDPREWMVEPCYTYCPLCNKAVVTKTLVEFGMYIHDEMQKPTMIDALRKRKE